jgi:hypothetical protein
MQGFTEQPTHQTPNMSCEDAIEKLIKTSHISIPKAYITSGNEREKIVCRNFYASTFVEILKCSNNMEEVPELGIVVMDLECGKLMDKMFSTGRCISIIKSD